MPEFALGHDTLAGPVPGRGPDGPWDDEDVLDQVLRLVADQHRVMGAAIGRAGFSPTIAELRQSPLGRDLRLLGAAGRDDVMPAAVQEAAARVKDLLLRSLVADDYTVPVWFWGTALGRLLARAERVAHGRGGLLSVGQVARRLGVGRAAVESWVAASILPAVPDEQGRPLVPRAAVEGRRVVALDLAPREHAGAEDVVLIEQRLAS